jgi:hypothetical protein
MPGLSIAGTRADNHERWCGAPLGLRHHRCTTERAGWTKWKIFYHCGAWREDVSHSRARKG